MTDFQQLIAQLLVLGVVGGGVSWFYAHLQKSRELRAQVLHEFASVHGRFVALRYRYNSFFSEGEVVIDNHPLTEEETRLERWLAFQTACELIGEFQSIKPLLQQLFPRAKALVDELHPMYHEWRTLTREGKAVLLEDNGTSTDTFDTLRKKYSEAARIMRSYV